MNRWDDFRVRREAALRDNLGVKKYFARAEAWYKMFEIRNIFKTQYANYVKKCFQKIKATKE